MFGYTAKDYAIIFVALLAYGIYYNYAETDKPKSSQKPAAAVSVNLSRYNNLWKHVIPDFGTVITGKPNKEGYIEKDSGDKGTILNGRQNIKLFVSKKNMLYAYELSETCVGEEKCKNEVKRIGKVLANTEPLTLGLGNGSSYSIKMADALAEIKIKETTKNYFLLTLKVTKK